MQCCDGNILRATSAVNFPQSTVLENRDLLHAVGCLRGIPKPNRIDVTPVTCVLPSITLYVLYSTIGVV